MRIWSQSFKRAVLAIFAVVVAFTWTQTGYTQAPCAVGRGIDPLDIINSGVRHNVWVVLDTSGSMNNTFPGGSDTKINVAISVIRRLMTELVDGADRPLVNWGFARYDNARDGAGKCGRPDAPDDLDPYSDQPDGCTGLLDTSFVPPSLCDGDSRGDIDNVLGGIAASGITPIGVAFTDIAEYLVGQHRPDDPNVTANTTNFVDQLLPGQKNFIIQVTDGRDTCECEDGGYPPVFTDPLVDPVVMRPNDVDSTFTETSSSGADIASYNAGLKGEVALQNIDPSLDGSDGNIFVLGMDLSDDDKRRLNTIAWMASGARLAARDAALMNGAFFADNEDQLVTQFQDILARVGIPESTLTLGASQVASVREVISSHTNPSLSPSEIDPPSNADAAAFRQARENRSDHRNNVLFATSVDVPGFRGHLTATNIYTVGRAPGDPDTGPLSPRSDRIPDFTELWDAGVELQDDDPDTRSMFFNRRGTPGVMEFTTANVTAADLNVAAGYLSELDGTGARTDDDARDIVVQVTRGYRLSLDATTGTIYRTDNTLNFSPFNEDGTPTWKLYENISGGVAVVSNPPRSPDFDPPLSHAREYGVGGSQPGDGFYWDHINRGTMVYYPSNFGILHAFDAETGAERMAFIPDDVMGMAPGELTGSRDTLKDVVALIVKDNNGIINHKFTLAGAPTVQDAFLRNEYGGNNEWRTVLVFGRGRGGRFITALDVTTVPSSPSSVGLLWNRGNREGLVEGLIDGLGETFSTPVLGNVSIVATPSPDDTDVDQWLVFAGGGYGCDNVDNEGQHLFAFRAEDGFIYFRGAVDDDATSASLYNALPARATLFNPHTEDIADANDRVTRVYIPDVEGKVWKLDTSAPDPADWVFGKFAEMGLDHPITAPVAVLNDVFDPSRVFVMGGSGGDRRADVPTEGFKFRTWIDSDADGSNTLQFPLGAAVPFEQVFEVIGERQFEQPVTLGRIGDIPSPVVFFAASEENFDADVCAVTFRSTLYAVGIESGLPEFDLDSTQSGDVSTDLGDGKAFLFARDGNVYVTESGGLGTSSSVSVWGDGEFDAPPGEGGFGAYTVAVRVDGFRISPF